MTNAELQKLVQELTARVEALEQGGAQSGSGALAGWKHDAGHTTTQARASAQWERDKAAGIAAD